MSKNTAERKSEKQPEAKKPVDLRDDELDTAQGGIAGGGGHDAAGPLQTKAGKTQLPSGFFTDFDNR